MMDVSQQLRTERPDHHEAMRLGATEYERLIGLLRSLGSEDWGRRTECVLWDVKAMVAHLLGNMEGNASLRELTHQIGTAKKRAKVSGFAMVDELTSLQISERAALKPDELVNRIEKMAPKAIKGRQRVPGVARRLVRIDAAPFGRIALGYLIDTVYTRDVWMHRIDICRASHRLMDLDAAHDGRLVSAIVGDWAARHRQPYELVLDGPAGGTFSSGVDGQALHMDAVEFCRIVSGRHAADAQGLLKTEVLF
jgi:uncharacterized protein (TIGR03083 family)